MPASQAASTVAVATASSSGPKRLPMRAAAKARRGRLTGVRPRRVKAKGSISGHQLFDEDVDLALGDRVDGDRRAADVGGADDAEADEELLGPGVEEVAALGAEAVHRHDPGVEDAAGAGLVAGLEAGPGLDERGGLAAERH